MPIDLKNETIHIRIAGVDAPEVSPRKYHSKYQIEERQFQGFAFRKTRATLCCRSIELATQSNPRKESLLPIVAERSIRTNRTHLAS